jgi:hypothetical protein
MVSQLMISKSSAKHLATRRFSQKGFVDLIFGHHRCPIPVTFSTLVQIRIEEITKLFYVIMGKKEEHNGHIKYGAKKNEFLDRKIATCDTENCISFVLSNKTKYMQSRQMWREQTFLPHHNACDVRERSMRAYFRFITKTKHMLTL